MKSTSKDVFPLRRIRGSDVVKRGGITSLFPSDRHLLSQSRISVFSHKKHYAQKPVRKPSKPIAENKNDVAT